MKKLLLVLLLTGCATAMETSQNPTTVYQKDMRLRVDGVKLDGGVYVFPRKSNYAVRADLYRRALVFKITSCHREWVLSEPGSNVDFDYTPMSGIEDRGLCPLELGAFDLKGQHTWAYIDFLGDESLTAALSCNGKFASIKGVSICQSHSGLIQQIQFMEPVEVYSTENCAKADSNDKKTFTMSISHGKCVYLFKGAKDIHRLTTIGYDDTLIRE